MTADYRSATDFKYIYIDTIEDNLTKILSLMV